MSAASRNDDRIISRNGGCHSCRNSRIQVMRKTQRGITFADFLEGEKRKASRIQKIS